MNSRGIRKAIAALGIAAMLVTNVGGSLAPRVYAE